jgi:transposase
MRKPAPATIKLILASGPKPSTTERRFPRYADIEDGAERRRAIIRLHADGWNAKSIAGYLEVSRQTVHTTLKRWAKEQFAGIEEKSHARTGVRKVDLTAVQEVKKLAQNPLIGAYRVSAALEFSFREQDKRSDEGATTPKWRLSASWFALTLEWSLWNESVRASRDQRT